VTTSGNSATFGRLLTDTNADPTGGTIFPMFFLPDKGKVRVDIF